MKKLFYYCKYCDTQVFDGDVHCSNCNSVLAADGAIVARKRKTSEQEMKRRDNIYGDLGASLEQSERKRYSEHRLTSMPVWLVIILHLITFGIFTFIYFGFKHGQLPRIQEDDPSTGKAIGFMFIPIYNIYWVFFFYLRLSDRINVQLALAGKSHTLSKSFVIVTIILHIIPYVNLLSYLILMPIMIGQMQYACNVLVKK